MRTDIIQTRGYNPNISGDELSLKIASYPATARYLAQRLKDEGDTVCELCCGIGVSLIELSKSFNRVIGVDSSAIIVEDCRKNPDLQELITNIRELITDKIVIYAPIHITYEEITRSLGPCEFMEVHTNGKHDRNFIFLGGLIKQIGETRVKV